MKAGITPVSQDEMYLFLLQHVPDNPRMPEERWPELLAEQLRGFGGALGAVRDGLGASSRINYRPLEVLLLPPPWHRGRAMLIGDAAHATTPHLASGAALALEDALVADRAVASHIVIRTGLRSVHDAALPALPHGGRELGPPRRNGNAAGAGAGAGRTRARVDAGAQRGNLITAQPRDDLDMGRMAELVDRRDRGEPIAAVDQHARVARKRRRIARHRDHERHGAVGELARLRLRALTRRIEHHGVEALELLRDQRPAEQVARCGLDRLQALRRAGRLLERGDRAGVVIERR